MMMLYPKTDINTDDITNILKKSLSETLTLYYPFAGRPGSKGVIECNDNGVEFFVARVNCKLSEILEKTEPQTIDMFYPEGVLWNESYKGSLLVVQVTFLNCGAVAISNCLLHKIADGGTVASFLWDWASLARNSGLNVPSPHFISKSLVPPSDPPIVREITKIEKLDDCVTRRFIFDASKLAHLKAMLTKLGVSNPSRVELVGAIIYKCFMTANFKAMGESSRPCLVIQPVNLRPRTVPPVPANSVGNFSWFSTVMVKNEKEKELHSLVTAMKTGMAQFNDRFGKNKTSNECYAMICDMMKHMMNKSMSDECNVYKGTSLCRFPFDDIDFGWGKPVWAGPCSSVISNTFVLKDAPDFGIEAWVTLREEEMGFFASEVVALF
ncbi:hypothetical protein AgCh_038707 [Apium graveolens]